MRFRGLVCRSTPDCSWLDGRCPWRIGVAGRVSPARAWQDGSDGPPGMMEILMTGRWSECDSRILGNSANSRRVILPNSAELSSERDVRGDLICTQCARVAGTVQGANGRGAKVVALRVQDPLRAEAVRRLDVPGLRRPTLAAES